MSEKLRVLVVDDDPSSAKTMGWAIEMFGHDVQQAHNGPKAMDVAASFKPHVVMLDIGMPGMNGHDVCKAMRAMPELAGTVFVAQTGWGDINHLEESRAAGFHHHMTKPIDMDALEKLLAGMQAA